MLRKLMTIAAVAGCILSTTPTLAAAQCKDAKGKFVKCPPAEKVSPTAKATPTVKATPAKKASPTSKATAAVASGGVTKDKNGKCHVASGPKKGQFTKCP
jgi:hypothetical protein